MTPLQIEQATALLPLLPPGRSDARQLVSRWHFCITNEPLREVPGLEAEELGRLVHRYRARMGEEQHARLCGVCRGTEELFGGDRPVATDLLGLYTMKEGVGNAANTAVSDPPSLLLTTRAAGRRRVK